MDLYPCRRTGLGLRLDMIGSWEVIPPKLRVGTMSIGATHKSMLKNHVNHVKMSGACIVEVNSVCFLCE